MRKLLNVLYVTTETAYLALNGETVDVLFEDGDHRMIPLHTLDGIVSFSYKGASPALMGKCAENGIMLSFFTPNGKYLADVGFNGQGNVLLRRTQFRWADSEEKRTEISRGFLTGKLFNAKYLLLKYARDHELQIDAEKVKTAAGKLTDSLHELKTAENTDSLRGIEGKAAAEYFSVFDELILQNKKTFVFTDRNRRPPTDPVNAMLSFAYTLLGNECASALRSVGLDPYVGFLHTDRPGRCSLALDLMEELRAVMADRFVLTLINNRIMNASDFKREENGAVLLKDDARKRFLSEWQSRKKEELQHPFLKEKIPWGLVPYVQSLLLSRFMRGDIDGYPPLLWK